MTYRGRRGTSGWSYCQQGLSNGGSSLPPAMTAEAISSLRGVLKDQGSCLPQHLLDHLRGDEEYSDVMEFFDSKQDIIAFARLFPGYFDVSADRVSLYEYSEKKFDKFLEKQCRPFGSGDAPLTPELITDVQGSRRQVDMLLARAKDAGKQLVLAVDCEGIKLGKDGPLTLLQIGTPEGGVFLFDVLATPDRGDMFTSGGLKVLLEDPNIMKVIHDCRADQCALYFQFGVVLKNVFDTSIAFMTIRDQCNNTSGPYRPKLALLLETYGMEWEQKLSWNGRVSSDIFGKRPLTKEMMNYAAEDVRCLVPMIYENLNRLISPLWRPYFEKRVELALAKSRVTDPHAMYDK